MGLLKYTGKTFIKTKLEKLWQLLEENKEKTMKVELKK